MNTPSLRASLLAFPFSFHSIPFLFPMTACFFFNLASEQFFILNQLCTRHIVVVIIILWYLQRYDGRKCMCVYIYFIHRYYYIFYYEEILLSHQVMKKGRSRRIFFLFFIKKRKNDWIKEIEMEKKENRERQGEKKIISINEGKSIWILHQYC